MAVDKDGGHLGRVDLAAVESLNDDVAGLQLVFAANFLGGHLAGAGNLPIEIVTLGGAEGRDPLTGLGKGGRPTAVGMDDAAQCRECVVQGQMGVGIAGGLPFTLHHSAVAEADHHHVLGGHILITDAGGLDDHETLLPVHTGNVAPGEGDQAMLGQLQVGLTDLFFQCFQHTFFLQFHTHTLLEQWACL